MQSETLFKIFFFWPEERKEKEKCGKGHAHYCCSGIARAAPFLAGATRAMIRASYARVNEQRARFAAASTLAALRHRQRRGRTVPACAWRREEEVRCVCDAARRRYFAFAFGETEAGTVHLCPARAPLFISSFVFGLPR